MNQGFAEALTDDFSALGWGTKKNAYTLRSETGDEVEFVVVGTDAGVTEALEVYHNGDLLESFNYDDVDFNLKLATKVNNLLEPNSVH